LASKPTNVKVTLKTIISDPNEREQIDVKTSGKFYEKEDTYVLMFNETVEDGNSVKNMVTIGPDRVSINRTGHVKMNQIFRTDHITESTYYHPFGTMRMETDTQKINFSKEESSVKGELDISYMLKLNEQEPQKHRLTLTFERKA
jgi:uncharacterized beta-barrel protein YwiB (DUF1934 family)